MEAVGRATSPRGGASVDALAVVTKTSLIAALLVAMPVCGQETTSQPVPNKDQELFKPETRRAGPGAPEGVIRSIEFVGLRRIPATTLRAKLRSKIGEFVDPANIERDVRALEAMGWFDSVSVELEQLPVLLALAAPATGGSDDAGEPAVFQQAPVMRLAFTVEERPFLAKVEYRGGQLLSQERIREVLATKKVILKLAGPCNRTELWRAAKAMEEALAELGHARAKVRVRLTEVPTAAMRATFVIEEGPRVEVERVQFSGNEAFPERVLQGEMKEVAPGALLAGWRGKTTYTQERLEKDLERVRQFYRNHGYAEAQTGEPQVEFVERRERRWWPWPGKTTKQVIHVKIPVHEGAAYRVEQADVDGAIAAAQEKVTQVLAPLLTPAVYSEEKIVRVKEELARLETAARARKRGSRVDIEATSQINREARTILVQLRARESVPFLVRRIEFTGHKRFSDRYYRRRIVLKEGEAFDAEKLERGLAELARGGFVRPAKGNDIQVKYDDIRRTADVTIHVEEIGRQRISLTGGANTLGIAYNVFNLLGGEELLTAHMEGGPESLQVLLGLAKESLFGTRASLGVSVFQNVVQPRLWGRGRLFRSRSSGLNTAWNYPLTDHDTLAVNYELSKNTTRVPLQFPALLPAGELREVRSLSKRSSVGLNWTRESRARRVEASTGVAGGWLGGSENSVRTSLTAARLQADPLSGGRNTWAIRGHWSGASSFSGATLPFGARSFAGEDLLRGFRRGELGPTVLTKHEGADGAVVYGTEAGGANAIVAINGEYRVPIESHLEIAAFLDAGTSWLVPQWLGGARPAVLDGTNGVPRGSMGVEMRLRLPVIDQTVRIHGAVNPWRLAQAILLPDGTKYRPTDRRWAFGWALGNLF